MTERPPLSFYVLAPYIKEIDEEALEATVHLPAAIEKRLRNPSFNCKQDLNDSPKREQIYLMPTHSNTDGDEASISDLIKKEFDNKSWHDTVEDTMKKSHLIQDKADYIDDRNININSRSPHDDEFTVRIDNLPEGYGREKLKGVLLSEGCNYFSRVVVPIEDYQFKRFGFIKFKKLRYALKFLEDYSKITVGEMVLNVALAV